MTRTTNEKIEFLFADEQTWWDWGWTHGVRAVFEMLDRDDLESMRRELFAELAALKTRAGIPMAQTAAFVVAEK